MKYNRQQAIEEKEMKQMEKFTKIYGFWCDCNTGIRLYAAVYYASETQIENGAFDSLRKNILATKKQFFEFIDVKSMYLPYKPKNVIKLIKTAIFAAEKAN